MTTITNTFLLFEETGRGQQSLDYTAVYELGVARLRVKIKIKRDSYDFQSYARASVWSPSENKWNSLASIHYSKMASIEAASYYGNPKPGQWYLVDTFTLLDRAREILHITEAE